MNERKLFYFFRDEMVAEYKVQCRDRHPKNSIDCVCLLTAVLQQFMYSIRNLLLLF